MDPIYLRMAERLSAVLVSGLCIFWGYRLFSISTEKQGELRLRGETFRLQLADVAPGIYFSLFGSVVLVFSIMTKTEFYHQVRNGDGVSISRSIASTDQVEPYIDPEMDGLNDSYRVVLTELKAYSEIIYLLSSNTAMQEYVDTARLLQRKSELLQAIPDDFWSQALTNAASYSEQIEIINVYVYYIENVVRDRPGLNETQQGG